MEIGNILNVLLILFSNINSIHGNFQFDLFGINGLSASVITVAGTEAVPGPPIKGMPGMITKGISFKKDTGSIKLVDANFAYIAEMLQKSDDITFAVYFKIMSTDRLEHTYFPFFALANTELSTNYFSIGLESKEDYVIVEGRKETKGIRWSVNIEQYKQSLTRKTPLPIHPDPSLAVKLGKWMTLMVRIKKSVVTISLDCKNVASGELVEGRIGKFSYEGQLTFSQMITSFGMKQFVGAMYEPQLINGQKAYDWYNPCTRDNTPSDIKPEPREVGYNNSKFEEFQEMSQQESRKPVIYCEDLNGVLRRNNGDDWNNNGSTCYRYRCVDGKIETYYDCTKCEDDDDNEYKAGDTWVDKNDKCKINKCVEYGELDTDVEDSMIVCDTLDCPVDEQYLPKGACCKKCRQDDCKEKRRYYNSCEKKCSIGVRACESKTKGCWCDDNWALNLEEDQCIPTRECKCKVDSGKIYLSGQSIKRSLCSNCICQHGELNCFDIC